MITLYDASLIALSAWKCDTVEEYECRLAWAFAARMYVLTHPEDLEEDGEQPGPTGVFSYKVHVHVTVEEGRVVAVNVDDATPFAVADCTLIEGNDEDLDALVLASLDGQDWPSWGFGV